MSRRNFIKRIQLILIIIAIILIAYIGQYFYDMSIAKRQSSLLNEISESNNIIENNILSSFNDDALSDNSSSLDNQNNTAVGENAESLHENFNNKIIEKNDRMLKIEELQKENPDIVGWIEIVGTPINYPVLQSNDNDFYLDKNYKKQKTQSGSIFVDADYSFSLPSTNLLIYGHNMKNGTMFTSLLNYKSKKYYEAHPIIRFTTNYSDVTYEIISAFESKVYDESDKSSFKYYNFINASNQNEFDYFVSNVKALSAYDTGKTTEFGDELMTLSTCAYHTKNGRFAVVAVNRKDK